MTIYNTGDTMAPWLPLYSLLHQTVNPRNLLGQSWWSRHSPYFSHGRYTAVTLKSTCSLWSQQSEVRRYLFMCVGPVGPIMENGSPMPNTILNWKYTRQDIKPPSENCEKWGFQIISSTCSNEAFRKTRPAAFLPHQTSRYHFVYILQSSSRVQWNERGAL